MKKVAFVVIILISIHSYRSGISAIIKHRYHFSSPIVQQQSNGRSLVYFPGCYQSGKIGEPTLPVYPIALLLPPGQAADKIKLIFRGKTKLDQKITLSPKQTPKRYSDSQSNQYLNQKIYNSVEAYSSFDPDVQTHFFFGHSIALACFSPIEYIPANEDLFYYSEVEVEITIHSDSRAIEAQKTYRSSKDIVQKLAKIVDNFEQAIGAYPYQNAEAAYDYLIITIDQWEPGALRWCFYGCNVLGDPAMSVWTNQIKQFANVDYPDEISDLPANITVQTGIANTRLTISDNGSLLTTAMTNNFGEAYFTIDSTLTSSTLNLTITAINYKPFVGKISLVTTGVNDQPSSGRISFELKPLFPNPFNNETTIQFSITKTNQVKLEVYNLNGQKIKTIFHNKLKPGLHQFIWNGRDENEHIASSGLYFVKLSSDEGIKYQTCVLLK